MRDIDLFHRANWTILTTFLLFSVNQARADPLFFIKTYMKNTKKAENN